MNMNIMGINISTTSKIDPKLGMIAKTSDEEMRESTWDGDINFATKDAGMPDARTRKSGFLDRTSALAASKNMSEFVSKLPKAELHVHIEGCLTPERCHTIVVRNGLDPKEFDPEEATKRRQCGSWLHGDYQPMMFCTQAFPTTAHLDLSAKWRSLRSRISLLVSLSLAGGPNEMAINAFLTEYTRCNATLRTEQDFYELMMDYLERAGENGVVRAEIFFDPQVKCNRLQPQLR